MILVPSGDRSKYGEEILIPNCVRHDLNECLFQRESHGTYLYGLYLPPHALVAAALAKVRPTAYTNDTSLIK